MSTRQPPSETITAEVGAWPGVEAGPGPRGGEFAFTVGGQEIGHLHGDRAAHFGFPRDVGRRLRDEGRVRPHPVNPHSPKLAARVIQSEEDVREVIELMRLNYDRVTAAPSEVLGLIPSRPQPLPFAPTMEIREFVLRRPRGNLLLYSASDGHDQLMRRTGGVTRQYLNHWHEALFMSGDVEIPLLAHAGDREQVEKARPVRAAFSRRHRLDEDFEVIPTPGHTPGATAYLWDNGQHRVLFTGDTLYVRDHEWVAAVLESSDRAAYIESLELIRLLDFDVLVPWAASAGGPYYSVTSGAGTRLRIDAIIERLRRGEDH